MKGSIHRRRCLLLGTYFRQLPSNESKRLDIIPVDAVCDGMTLIAAAIVERRHDELYQLATSATNPCDMGRSIELTSLAHRKALPGAGGSGILAAVCGSMRFQFRRRAISECRRRRKRQL